MAVGGQQHGGVELLERHLAQAVGGESEREIVGDERPFARSALTFCTRERIRLVAHLVGEAREPRIAASRAAVSGASRR